MSKKRDPERGVHNTVVIVFILALPDGEASLS
jgi:hypothetical protein